MSKSATPQPLLARPVQDLAVKGVRLLSRCATVAVLVPLIAVQVGEAATLRPQSVTSRPIETAAIPDSPMPQNAPDSQAASSPQAPAAAQSQQQTEPSTPAGIGTAAAPVESPVGVAASKPAGAAIAPARQRRTRTFAIRIAILVGVAVGVGTVVALSKGSPSRP